MSVALEQHDRIAAIATPPGRGGVGIVRISGASLASLGMPLLGRALAPGKPRRVSFLDAAGRALDDGLVLFFPAPHSYTGEDVLELHGHGGPVVMNLLLARVLELGARLAEPGEFTRRAFLNDKLDLAQAEAVADLIDASTTTAARAALRSLKGDFSKTIYALLEQLVYLRLLTEATLDFPEEDIDPLDRADARKRLSELRAALALATAQGRRGSLLRTGLNVVIVGEPNVGKSSLLNRLAGDDVAIVTAIPGTTRDTLRQAIEIDGVPLNVIDTAGLRATADEVERLGIERTWREVERADIVMAIVVGDTDAVIDDARLAPRVVVHNKIDLTGGLPRVERRGQRTHVYLSATGGQGIDLLQRALLLFAGWQPGGEDVFIARERHLQALIQAATHLERGSDVFGQTELLAEELRLAQHALNAITGEFTADDLLGEIFSRFCIGK